MWQRCLVSLSGSTLEATILHGQRQIKLSSRGFWRMLDISRSASMVDSASNNGVVHLESNTSKTSTSQPPHQQLEATTSTTVPQTNNTSTSATTTTIRRKYCTSINGQPSMEEVREFAHRICRDYLHGAWLNIKPDQMIFKKVSGGLSNLLYYCELPHKMETEGTEPQRLLLRLYGNDNSARAIENLITESVIFALLSETQRGPRLYGVFSGGRLEEFIQARPLRTSEISKPEISALIADKLAQIHLMDVPINKQPKRIWQTMQKWIKQIEELVSMDHVPKSEMVEAIKTMDLAGEYCWLKEYLTSIKSPVVFCHNDLQEGNILLREKSSCEEESSIIFPTNEINNCSNNASIVNNNNYNNEKADSTSNTEKNLNNNINNTVTHNSELTSDNLVVIDFEYCSYNHRGFDFANHFCEWMYDYSNQAEPYFWYNEANRATRSHMEYFIKNYLKSLAKHPEYKWREIDTVERILHEVQAFTLASHFFWALWSVINTNTSAISFDYWSYGELRFKAYFEHKKELLGTSKIQI